MRVRATNKRRMTHSGQFDVVQELPGAAYHPIVGHAPLPLTCFCHDRSPQVQPTHHPVPIRRCSAGTCFPGGELVVDSSLTYFCSAHTVMSRVGTDKHLTIRPPD